MPPFRLLLLFFASGLSCVATEPTPEPSPKIQTFTGGWGKWAGTGSRPTSRFDGLAPDQLKKTGNLAQPVTITILSTGRTVDGLEDIKDRIIDVRVTNLNPYSVLFRGRQYRGNTTIVPGWNKLENESWVLAGWDGCGTGVRDWEIKPNESVDLMLYLHPSLKEQQILGRFYRADKLSTQSDCLLYESK